VVVWVVYDLKSWLEMQRMLQETMKPYFEMLGLDMYVDRIVLKPEDCPETCIDYVWRITCRDKEVCDKLREEIVKQSGESGEQGGEEGGEEEKR
jgi:hypothetical protein